MYAVKVVYKDRKYFGIDGLMSEYSKYNELSQLTLRESNVFKELGKRASNKQIANNLYISENTVKRHVSSILYKLGFSKRAEIAISTLNLVGVS